MSDERVDTSDCLAHLEEFLDTLVALPHDTQRLLSLLKEQDACASSLHDELVVNITAAGLLPTDGKMDKGVAMDDEKRQRIEDSLASIIAVTDEKTGIADQLLKIVGAHIKKLEDEVCAFEREICVARASGALSAEEAADISRLLARHDNEALDDSNVNNLGEKQIASCNVDYSLDSKDCSLDCSLKGGEMAESVIERVSQSPKSKSKMSGDEGLKVKNYLNDTDQILEKEDLTVSKAGVGKRNSRDSGGEKISAKTESGINTYCICGKENLGDMIGCDNRDCPVEWFHYSCVGLSAPPLGKWYCPDCVVRVAKRGRI